MKNATIVVALCCLLACAVQEQPATRGSARAATSNADSPLLPTSGARSQPPPGAAGALTNASQAAQRPPISVDQTGRDNAAGVDPQEVAKLKAGGPLGNTQLLYPYDGTVFPRGLLAPTLMWSGAEAADAAYVHLYASSFEYSGVLTPSVDPATRAPALTLPQEIWERAGQQTNGKADPFTLELSLRSRGEIVGPLKLHFVIAAATVKGSIYYNSYASKLPGAALGGNVLRIAQGGQAELYTSMQCNGCHSVSANGSTMLSQSELKGGGAAYDIVSGGAANPVGKRTGPRASFAALYPDGSKYLATSVSISVAHADIAQPDGAPLAAALYDTLSGQVVPDTGIPESAAMPMFSTDGTRLVFTDVAVDKGDALAVMDYDPSAHKATNYRVLMRDMEMTRPGWPFFLPDSNAVVFVRTVSPDFSGNGAYIGAGMFAAFAGPFASLATAQVPGPASDLYLADLATGAVTLLAQAMGFATPQDAAGNRTTLPFADDTHQSYFPTVAPVAAGGYFWVFFDAIRHYGNRGTQRQLWGFAIDIQPSGRYEADLSHPAFYLPGQEPGAGNHRAFAALDPCKMHGDSCTSGIDCCGGSCEVPSGGQAGSCVQRDGCAKRDERCQRDSDCCAPAPGQAADTCIAGFCAYVPLN